MVVECGLKPVWFNGGDMPPIAAVERRSQLFLTDWVRARIRIIITEAQHMERCIVLSDRCQTCCVSRSLVAIEGVEQSAVQHCLKLAPQTLQLERVSRSELNLDPTIAGLFSGDCQCRFSYVNTQNL
jgi:hypothetical protein